MDLYWQVMSLLFNMLSRLVINFLPRSKRLLISWLQPPSAVILEPQNVKWATVSPPISHKVMGLHAMILFSECWALSQLLHSPLLLSSRGFLVPLHFCIRVVSSAYLRLLIFLPEILIPACASSSPAFLMMYSAYKLNKQGDNTALA